MTCSARSFGSRWSCSDRIASSRSSEPRGRVPAIGCVVSLSPSTWRSSSGEAPTTSEAGHDQLVGYLDGADCQHLLLTDKPARHAIVLRCGDWERTPWFDAVLHDKFSLHGVGYSVRYQGGRSRGEHGIESDDYLSAELLAGHALMIDRGAFGGGAVRKYWLAQDVIRSLAPDRIRGVDCAGGDIHRQTVTWESGAKVHVNRGRTDWPVAGRVLPPYGYLARAGEAESSVERIGGVIAEQSRGPGRFYVNGRGFNPSPTLRLRPSADRVEYLGGRRFKLVVAWQADRPAPKDLTIFRHFLHDKAKTRDRVAFQGDHRPRVGTSSWKGRVETGGRDVIRIPDEWGPGEYEITIGLYDPPGGRRHLLIGQDDGSGRFGLGTLVVEGEGGRVSGVRLVKREPKPMPAARWNVDRTPVDFGAAVTSGAFRCERKEGGLVLTPLPDQPAFDVSLRLARILPGPAPSVTAVEAVDAGGKVLRKVAFTVKEGVLALRTTEGEFAYRIRMSR